MKVFVANRLEKLVESLAGQLKTPLASPLAPETIVVQSAGMSRWLYLELAKRHGVAANYRFPFPNAFAQEIFSAFLPDDLPDMSFDESVLTWRIIEILEQLPENEEYIPIRTYLGGESDPRKTYQLAKKIAWTFDQYLVFRPDMILKWEAGTIQTPNEIWQASLWRKLLETQSGAHKAALRRKLLAEIGKRPRRAEMLPERLSVFGISYLPPYHLEMLVKLSVHLPVNYYYLNPSREFWADIKSGQEISRALSKIPEVRALHDDNFMHWESGNSLLASWGAQGRDFFRLMEDLPVDYCELFQEPDRATLLHKVQSDIYLLREDRIQEGLPEKILLNDDSIQIHACHAPLREVETLHDVLLGIFEKDRQIMPRDVLVMTPDIELYAPYIESVFEARTPKIPYTIADRCPLSANSVAGGLLLLLELAESRFTTGDVLGLLENHAIREKFEITSADRELISHWVHQTHVKWGIDAAHRHSFDLPVFDQNTWRNGLSRLMAGFTLDGRRQELYAGILPYGEIESSEAEVLGRFLTFWEKIVEIRDILLKPHPLKDWCGILKSILKDCLSSSDKYQQDLSLMQQMISKLQLEQKQSGSIGVVALNVVKDYLRENARAPGQSPQFLAGGVSFCAMLPMRSIPFAVICLLGMDQDAYPRRDVKTGFNVMETQKRAGDRSLRNDDQYVFLEALLSARKYFVIMSVGQSLTDNSPILPSAQVCELLDYLEQNYHVSTDMITRKHPLHAFSPVYFGDEKKWLSYSRPNYLAARAILGVKEEKHTMETPFCDEETLEKTISIADLRRFYRDPARYFLENRLRLKLPEKLWLQEYDSEPFTIDSLSAYLLKQELVENYFVSGDDQGLLELKRAEGVLPVGSAGDYYFNALNRKAGEFAEGVVPYLQSSPLEKLSVNLSIGDEALSGSLENLREDFRISYRMAELTLKDYLDAWIAHVILNVKAAQGYPQTSVLLGEDSRWCFEPLQDAPEQLNVLMKYFRLGRTRPLKLFARSSWEYASALWLKNKTRQEALAAARLAWQKDESGRVSSDSEEIACKICFEDVDPIDEEFEKTAEDILKELFAHMKKGGLTHDGI